MEVSKESSDQLDKSCEPMDIDLSQNSIDKLNQNKEFNSVESGDVNYGTHVKNKIKYQVCQEQECDKKICDSLPSTSRSFKKFSINLKSFKRKDGERKILWAFFIAATSFLAYIIFNLECSGKLDIKHIKKSLTSNLYGQSAAINQIVKALVADIPIKLLLFHGGTGVGKTYASSLIFNNLWNCSNVYHYTVPSFWDSYSSNLMLGLILCKGSVIIVDGLTINDKEMPMYAKELIAKNENLRKNLTMILIYNSDITSLNFTKHCDTEFNKKIESAYNDITKPKYFIKFAGITEEILKKCIENELRGKQNVNKSMNNILQNFNATLDGCKSVHSNITSLDLS